MALTVTNGYTEDSKDEYPPKLQGINPYKLVTEERLLQFAREFKQSLMNSRHICNDSFIHEQKVEIPKKHLNFKGLILQAKSQSKQ
jgi:hypothetical protein